MSSIKIHNEPVTARRLTRLKFLDNESDHLRTIKSDLEYCLINSKQVLNDVLTTKIISGNSNLDRSADTDIASHVSLRQFESTLAKNIELYSQLTKIRQERDLGLGKALISEQIAEESNRKEQEFMTETDDQINDLKYLMDKKDNRIKTLNTQLKTLEDKYSEIKNENAVILPLSESSLNFHMQMEKIKISLSNVSKQMQRAELQRDELIENAKVLESTLDKYKVLVKNPMIRNKRAGTYAVDMSYDVGRFEHSSSSDSSEEITFPDKFQMETKHKPSLPKLDFSKISVKKALTDVQDVSNFQSQNKMKNKIKDLENLCKEKTEFLNILREKVGAQKDKNQKLIENLCGKKQMNEMPELEMEPKKSKRKRPMSDTLDYVMDKNVEIPKRGSEESKVIIITSNLNSESEEIISFNGSEVPQMEDLEMDSVLVDMEDFIK